MPSTGHLSVRQGMRVRVYLRSGEHYNARFKERRARVVNFFDHVSEPTRNIRTLTIYKS